MITHRDKKPHECKFQDCGKSYCDMRSLRRHVENHHNSPPGGSTPASYMPKLMLYPGYREDDAKTHNERPHQSNTGEHGLNISEEPPRPSSAPLAPPEPKRITRTRRSSSGEETHLQLDPSMLREIEHYKKTNHPYGRHDMERAEEFIQPRDKLRNERMPHPGYPPHLSATSRLLKQSNQYSDHSPIKHPVYDRHAMDPRMDERHRQQMEYDKHLTTAVSRDSALSATSSATGSIGGERLKEYESISKHDYSAPGNYTHALPPRISSSYLWTPHQQNTPPRPSPAAPGTMPYLLNIRNPFNISPHAYPSPTMDTTSTSESSKIMKSELDARQQAVNTYWQMWANGQHNLTPEQLFNHSRRLDPHARANLPPTPTDAISIAVATAKEPNDHRHPFNVRDGLYGIHPTNAKWQPVSVINIYGGREATLRCF